MKSYFDVRLLVYYVVILFTFSAVAQNPSAILDLSSTTEGFLLPRMTTMQRDLIEIPSEGMMIFDRTTQLINYFDGADSSWIELRPTDSKRDIADYFAGLPNGLQMLLDAGETPANLLKLGVSPVEIIGNFYNGGFIFYLDSLGQGLVVAPEDQSNSLPWGCDGILVEGADGIEVGTGLQNSLDIESVCLGENGARACLNLSLNGFRDWYLPSQDELNLVWLNLADSDGDGNNIGPTDPNNIGGFRAGVYWTSTESDQTQANFQVFSNGDQRTDGKEAFHSIRAVRAISK